MPSNRVQPRHFLRFRDLKPDEVRRLLARAEAHRASRLGSRQLLAGRVLAMVFERSSTRTRISFEAGMAQLGGHAIFLASEHAQLARGESLADTARAVSSMADAVMLRTARHADQEAFAAASCAPVINGLSDLQHPCQALADVLTFEQKRGPIAGASIAWLGDANNVCASLIDAAATLGFTLKIAGPAGYGPSDEALAYGSDAVSVLADPLEAAAGAACVMTDVWASMGDEREAARRRSDLAPYQVSEQVMAAARPDAIFMHCLPAHRGEEVAAEVIDGPASAVWLEAENRLHVQKALLEFLIAGEA